MRSALATVTVLACASRLVTAQSASLASVTFQTATVPGGATVTAVITLTAPAGNNGLDVALSISSSVAHLSSAGVTVGSGLTSATVSITTTPTSTAQVATLTASSRGESRTANLTVTPPSVSALAVTPASVGSGSTASATVTLNGVAPPGGTIVTLTRSNSVVTSPSTITIPAGQLVASYSVGASAVSATTTVTLSAAAGGTSRSTTLTIAPPVAVVTFTGFQTHPVESGENNYIRVHLDRPAPPGGIVVQLSISDPGIVRFMPTVATVAEGSDASAQAVRMALTGTDRSFTISGSFSGLTRTTPDTLRAARLVNVFVNDTMITGTTQVAQLLLSAFPATNTLPIVIQPSNAAIEVASPPSGSTAGDILRATLKANSVASPTAVTVTFSFLEKAISRTITVLPPALDSFTVSPSSVHPGGTFTATATLTAAAPTGGKRVHLSQAASTSIATITLPDILIPAGATRASATITVPNFPTIIPVTVSITAALDQVTRKAAITLTP